MGLWSFYFLAKLYLHFRGYLHLHIALNILFAFLLTVQIPEKYRYRALSAARLVLGLVIGAAMLWYDSWLSSPLDSMTFLQTQGLPSKEYIASFVLGSINPKELLAAVVILFVCMALNRFFKMTPIVVLLLLAVIPFREIGKADAVNADQMLESFYDYEAQRVVRFRKTAGAPEFDIVILHVCSLSNDDLRVAGLSNDPLFSSFNYLFTKFNTATSYSGPAVIRLARAACGQPDHESLYEDTARECFLFEALSSQSYEPQLAFNHNGEYGNFLNDARQYARIQAEPLKVNDLPIDMYMFDNSPIHDDYRVLERWWKTRSRSSGPSAALYYNSVTLHDGVHWAGEKKWFQRNREEQYAERTRKLLENIRKFFDLIEASGRNVVVVFIPEHGMSLKGTNIQVQGLRDIPLPQITTVPVGVKVFGKGFAGDGTGQKIINKPTSYLALAHMLSQFMRNSPYLDPGYYGTRQFLDGIPQTDFVAENLGMVIMRDGTDYWLYGKDKKWTGLSETELN